MGLLYEQVYLADGLVSLSPLSNVPIVEMSLQVALLEGRVQRVVEHFTRDP